MADKYAIEFRVTGETFKPEAVSPKEIAAFITAIDQMIAAIVSRDNPELAITSEDVVLGLFSITQGSLVARFVTQYEEEVSRAYSIAAESVVSENYDRLPYDAIESLKELRRFNRKHNTQTEFVYVNGHDESLAKITPKTKIWGNKNLVKTKITRYGTLTRIGGDDPPRAWIHFTDGTKLSCRVKTKTLASQLAQYLYQRIGVRGTAEWDVRDNALYEFRIDQLLDYRPTSPINAFSALAEASGKYYEDIDDLDQFVAEIRGIDENGG